VKKGGLAILMGGGAPPPGEDDDMDDDASGDVGEEKRKAMDAFIDAVHAKDTDAAIEAFDALADFHDEDEEKPEAEAEGEQGDEDTAAAEET
jgi:hypothetical protein